MILWLVLTVMTSVAAVLVAAPFLRDWDRPRAQEEKEIFFHQLEEIDRECASGGIDAPEAHAATLEIQRRLLAAPVSNGLPPLSAKERAFAAVGVAGIIVLGSVGLFAISAGQAPMAQGEAAVTQAPAQPQAQTLPVEEMIRRLSRRLQSEPEDVTGWRTLGWAQLQTEAYAEAAQTYARAIALQPEAADNYSARAEALIKASHDNVDDDAQEALDAALARDPKDARARYWLGRAKMQKGDKAGAAETWRALLADGAEGEFAAEIRRQIAALDGAPATDAQVGQSAMIASMVDRLEQRLATTPGDAQGWIRLLKSRMVLGDVEKARTALTHALDAFAPDTDGRRRIEEAAKEAGL